MSAIEWLHFINPLIIIMMTITFTACVPITSVQWQKHLQLNNKPLALKKFLMSMFALTALGWVLAKCAIHITTPIIRVNMVATSQLVLTLALIAIGMIILIRVFQKNNLLSLILILIKHNIPILVTVIGTIFSALALIFIHSLDSNSYKKAQQEDLDGTDEENAQLNNYMNYRGEFCDKNKTNWY